MSEFLAQNGALLAQGTWETLYMTLASTLFAYLLGTPMGVLLTVTEPGAWLRLPGSTPHSAGWSMCCAACPLSS